MALLAKFLRLTYKNLSLEAYLFPEVCALALSFQKLFIFRVCLFVLVLVFKWNFFYLSGFLFHPFFTGDGFKVSRYLDKMERTDKGQRCSQIPVLTISQAWFQRWVFLGPALVIQEEEAPLKGSWVETLTDFTSGEHPAQQKLRCRWKGAEAQHTAPICRDSLAAPGNRSQCSTECVLGCAVFYMGQLWEKKEKGKERKSREKVDNGVYNKEKEYQMFQGSSTLTAYLTPTWNT